MPTPIYINAPLSMISGITPIFSDNWNYGQDNKDKNKNKSKNKTHTNEEKIQSL